MPAPGVDSATINSYFSGQGGTVLGLLNLFSGSALSRFSIFALGIMPYVTASIILQLLTVVVPSLEQLQKEGEAGYAKINQYTRYLTVALAAAPRAPCRSRGRRRRARAPLAASSPGAPFPRPPVGSCSSSCRSRRAARGSWGSAT